MPDISSLASPAHPTSLQVDLARRIAQLIYSRDVQAGDHLSEEPLAQQFQVSRTPIRGALRLLAEKGLIAYHPNRGYRVNALQADAPRPEIESREPTPDELYRRLLDDHVARQLPGPLIERELSQRYGVTRSTVTKSLLRMSADGLIEKRKGYGWQFVPSLESPSALAESYRYRIAVECAGLLEPEFSIDAAELERMRAAHERLLTRDGPDISASDFFALNATFHEMLARFSGNRYILQAVQQQNQLRRLEEHAAFYRDARFVASSQEHLQIIAALKAGDRDWAAQLLRHHLRTALQVS